jgi:hypothetical protein
MPDPRRRNRSLRPGRRARRRCWICSTANCICCGSSPSNSCRRRSLPSPRGCVSGSTWRHCGRSRMFDECCRWPGGRCARRHRTRRGRAYRRAGGGPAVRGPARSTIDAPAGASNELGPDPARIGCPLLLAYSAAPRRCEKVCSWLVMNSRSAAFPSSFCRRARRIAAPICAGSSTRSLHPPRSRPILA